MEIKNQDAYSSHYGDVMRSGRIYKCFGAEQELLVLVTLITCHTYSSDVIMYLLLLFVFHEPSKVGQVLE